MIRRPRPPLEVGRRALIGCLVAAATGAAMFSQFFPARLLFRLLPLLALVVLAVQDPVHRLGLRLPIPLVLFVGWACTSYLWTADPSASRQRLADLVALAVIGWCCGSLATYRDLHHWLSGLFRAVVVATFAAVLVAPGWSTRPSADGVEGWHGFFAHKNGLGAFAVLAAVTFALESGGSRRRWCWVGAASILVLGSGSATALGLSLLLLGVFAWLQLPSARGPLTRSAVVAASYPLALAGAILVITQFDVLTGILGRGSSLTGRTPVWDIVWTLSQQRPLGGYGFGGLWESAGPPTSEIWKAVRFRAFHAHSAYLDILVQVGLVGLCLFTVLIGTAAGRALRARPDRSARWAATVLGVLAVNGIVESSPFFGFGFLLVALIGTAGAQDWHPRRALSAFATTPARMRSSSSSL